MEQYAVYFALACAAAAVVYGLASAQWILGLPQGTSGCARSPQRSKRVPAPT